MNSPRAPLLPLTALLLLLAAGQAEAQGSPAQGSPAQAPPVSPACARDAEGVRLLVDRLQTQAPILFHSGQGVIDYSAVPLIEAVARRLQRCPGLEIEVQVHTDSQGSGGFNARVSQAMAEELIRMLVRAGADPRRLVACGYGESRPIDTNSTEAGRERNRRVVFARLSGPALRHQCPPVQ